MVPCIQEGRLLFEDREKWFDINLQYALLLIVHFQIYEQVPIFHLSLDINLQYAVLLIVHFQI
jgi:hypothetical protein